MNHLYMMIYLAGQLVGTVGPLPYDMDECLYRADKKWHEGKPDVVTPDGLTMRDIKLTCEYHESRPKPEGAVRQ